MILKKINIGILALLAGISGLKAQHFNCGTVEMTEAYHATHPEWAEKASQLEQRIKKIQASSDEKTGAKSNHLVVPIVFHIIHDGGSENISDAQIKSEVANLNLRYNNEMWDTTEVAPAFKGIIADVGIEFRLPTKDPQGECTTGIIRYRDSRTSSAGDEVKQGRQWDARKYLNVYVVRNIGSGAGGYAYIPGTVGPDIDGIVVRSDLTGTIGTSRGGTRQSTMAHEVGHWLGLRHTWGPTNTPGMASNCEFDDEVEDTPLTTGGFGCNPNRVTCGSLDNVHNYMDYTGCLARMFTNGQKDRMLNFIAGNIGDRGNLTSAANAVVTGTDYPRDSFPDYLCKAEFSLQSATEEICPGSEVSFLDESLFGVDAWKWTFPGGIPSVSTEKNPTILYNESGVYDVTLTIYDDNGDSLVTTKQDYVTVADPGAMDFPAIENFYNPFLFEPAPEGYFTRENPGDDSFWEIVEGMGYRDDRCAGLYTHFVTTFNNVDIMTSGLIQIPDGVFPYMSFAYSHVYKNNEQKNDFLEVSISNDCGLTWDSLTTIAGDEFATASPRENSFEPTSVAQWREKQVELDGYAGESVRIRFKYTHRGGNNVFIDRLEVTEAMSISGLDEVKVDLFPNPTSANSSFQITTDREIEYLVLSNQIGQKIAVNAKQKDSKNWELSVGDISNGIYYFSVITKSGTKTLPVIIK
ncbi:M43 family zinc metalloprotease [Luteibaculum oceani]|uniref:T9SS type A sorting domain-containing protein n=1 Tax=Luteibaculum oceani TaxID=1294296 RepID=A0A5C6VLI9_9FLAO|nr:M43 family zinc metalloprotease [Luteibaculum oceani]TXC85306.1 T9SS type A sorting domain-containing protein [Luteibaculum oceani]